MSPPITALCRNKKNARTVKRGGHNENPQRSARLMGVLLLPFQPPPRRHYASTTLSHHNSWASRSGSCFVRLGARPPSRAMLGGFPAKAATPDPPPWCGDSTNRTHTFRCPSSRAAAASRVSQRRRRHGRRKQVARAGTPIKGGGHLSRGCRGCTNRCHWRGARRRCSGHLGPRGKSYPVGMTAL